MLTGQTPRSRFLLFGGLYFAQGVPWGFFTIALQLRLTGLGFGPRALAEVMAMAWLPWAAKPLLGPLVDRVSFGRFGRRRPFVLLAQVGMALSLLLLAMVDPAKAVGLFSGLVLLHNVFAATQDVGVDALAIDLLAASERGRANGIMAAGKYAGMIVGGQGLLWVGNRWGWSAAFMAAVVLLSVAALVIWRVKEGPPVDQAGTGAARSNTSSSTWTQLLRQSFLVRVVMVGIVFAFLSDLSDGFLTPMTFPLFKRTLGYSDDRIATLSSLAALATVTGSLLGGALTDRIGRRWALLIGCIGVALTNVVFAAGRGAWGNYAFVLSLSLAGALASGVAFVASVALFMDMTNRRLGATQFQVYMSVANLRISGAMSIGGRLAEKVAPESMYFAAGIIELIPLALLPFVNPRRAQEEFARVQDVQAAAVIRS